MATSTVDLSGLDTGNDEQIDQPVEQIQGDGASVVDSQSPVVDKPLDGRRGPQNIRDSVKAVAEWAQNNAAEALPEHAQGIKALGDAFFREQAYKQHFPSPQEAANAKNLIEGLGGLEGATQLQQRIATYDAQDAGLKEGNPEVLDAAFKDFPEGMATLAPHFLEKLAQSNPQAFQNAVAPHVVAMLDQSGVGGFIESILKEGDADRKNGMLQQLQQWYNQQKQNVSAIQQPSPKNPAQDRISQREQELNQREEQMFQGQVSEKVNTSVSPELNKHVDQYAKSYKLNDKQKARFSESVANRVAREMESDQTYMKQLEIRKANKGKTADSIASYISSEFNRRLKDAAFAEAQELYGAPRSGASPSSTGVVKADAPKTAANGGPLYVSQRPADSDLDLSRPGADKIGRAHV